MKKTKNKILGMVFTAVTCVTAFLFGAAPITAMAGGIECTCEHKCTEDCIDPDCELCKMDYTLCCGEDEPEPEEPAEEPMEEPAEEPAEEMGPLTPDGNLTLVDDYGSPEKSGKQFITVVTKAGNYFYIIIDRDDNGNETVHFLNMVDEADLLSLMDEEDVDQYLASKGIDEPAEVVTPAPTEEPEEPEPVEEPEPEKKGSSGALVVVLILVLAGAGGYFYITKIKGKKNQSVAEDPDADYIEEDDDYLSSLADQIDEIMTEDEIDDMDDDVIGDSDSDDSDDGTEE